MSNINLYNHQKTALSLLRVHDGFALFMEQGTGKTFPILFRLAELAQSDRIAKALIVAPKAVCESWHAKIKLLSKEQQINLSKIQLDIVSYELVWRRKEYMTTHYDAVVCDESHYIKSTKAKRTKACMALAAKAKYRYILTGTPTSNGQLCNLWSQFATIDPVEYKARNGKSYIYPKCFGGDSYYRWIERVAYLDKWHKPYKYKDVDKIQSVMGEKSYRITKSECLDLPEKLPDEILYCEMPSKTKRDYKEMVKHSAIVALDTLASNPLTRSLRLRQICSGFLDTENNASVDYPCTKLDVLKNFLSDYDRKFVIFCEFRKSIDSVQSLLSKMKIKSVTLDGRSKGDEWCKFQEDETVQAIVCQYQSGSAGIDLYAANLCIFFEPTLRSDLLEQARDRIHRVGQKNPCSYYHLLTSDTIEFAIYRALQNYEDFNQALFAQYISEYTKGETL